MRIDIRIDGAADGLRQLREQLSAKTRHAAVELAQRALAETARLTPVDTGRLQRSFLAASAELEPHQPAAPGEGHATIHTAENATTIEIQTDVPYAAFVELGTHRTPPRLMLKRGLQKALAEGIDFDI